MKFESSEEVFALYLMNEGKENLAFIDLNDMHDICAYSINWCVFGKICINSLNKKLASFRALKTVEYFTT